MTKRKLKCILVVPPHTIEIEIVKKGPYLSVIIPTLTVC